MSAESLLPEKYNILIVSYNHSQLKKPEQSEVSYTFLIPSRYAQPAIENCFKPSKKRKEKSSAT